jgi:hypothetical protein
MVERSLMDSQALSIKRVNAEHTIPLGAPCGLCATEAYFILTPHLLLGGTVPGNSGLKL